MAIARFLFVRAGAPALATLFLASCVGPAAAQYMYQPSPSYYQNNTASGTVVGGGLGAITGAIIGGSGNRGEGALIGAGIGAVTGRLMGKSVDAADEREAAYGASVAAQANAHAAAQAVSNYDLAEMTRAGLSDEVIISTIRSRGGRFDLSPGGLIALKQSGVSDRVVMAAQSGVASSAPTVLSSRPPVVVSAPPAVYYRPAPPVRVYIGPPRGGYYGRGYHGHRRHW